VAEHVVILNQPELEAILSRALDHIRDQLANVRLCDDCRTNLRAVFTPHVDLAKPHPARVSTFVRPGWFLAMCEDTTCATQGPARHGAFQDRDERDRFVAEHRRLTGHRVVGLDGPEPACTCDQVDVSTIDEGPGTSFLRGRADPDCPVHRDAECRAKLAGAGPACFRPAGHRSVHHNGTKAWLDPVKPAAVDWPGLKDGG
jgi:hypothetical protein